MSESTSRAQFSVSGSPAPLFYVWQVTGKPLAAGICVDLIEPLDRQAVETFRSIDSRGTEVGGLLWGSLTPGEPAVAYVEEFETIACDYSRGPLYRLAEADLARMDAAIERRKGSGVEVVGFFRSHTRRGLGLDTDDMALIESRFRDPRQFALLIRPFASKASTAGIFIWESGKMQTEASYLEFPFQAAQLTTSSSGKSGAALSAANPKQAPRAKVISMMSRLDIAPPEPPARPAAPPPPAAPAPPPAAAAEPPKAAAPPPAPAAVKPAESAVPEPRKPEPQADAKFKKGKQKPGSRPSAGTPEPPAAPEAAVQTPPPAEPAPAFSAPSGFEDAPEPRRGKMMWIWGAVAAVLLVCSGALFIYPGLMRKQVRPMTPLTLHIERTASDILLTWNRDSDAIKNAKRAVLSIYDGDRQENFDMDLAQLHNGSIVYAPLTQDVSFKMELTGADQSKIASEMVRVLRTRPSPMGDPGTQAAPAAAPTDKAEQVAKTATTTEPEQPAEAVQEEAAPARTTPVRAFNADSLSQRLRPALPTEAPAAPSLSASAPVASMNLGVIVPSQIAAPARPSAAGSSAAPAPKSSQVVPAQVISRKEPIYPQLAKQTGASGQVRVSVTIGVDGKVKSVKAISGHILLQRAATDAVKQWVYRPTMLNGVAVESQSEVMLTFNPLR